MKKIILITLLVLLCLVFLSFYFLNKDSEQLSLENIATSTGSNSQSIEDRTTSEINTDGSNIFSEVVSVDLAGVHSSRRVAVGTAHLVVVKRLIDVKEYAQTIEDVGRVDIFLCYQNGGPEECLLIKDEASLNHSHSDIAKLEIDLSVPVNSDAYVKLVQSNKPESMVKSPLFKVVESIGVEGGRASFFDETTVVAREYNNGLVGISVSLKIEGGPVYVSTDPEIALEISNSTSVQFESIKTEFFSSGSSDDYFYGISAGMHFDIMVQGIDLDDEQFLENSLFTIYYSDDPSNLRKFNITEELKDFSIRKI